jgi:hypothetical protein
MRTAEDIESYLIRMGQPYDDLGDGLYLVHDEARHVGDVAIKIAGPIVVFRAKVMDVPPTRREELFRLLLDMNAKEMVHGAYGIDDDAIVMTDTLPLENLDFTEVQAVLDDFSIAVTNHYPRLRTFSHPAP